MNRKALLLEIKRIEKRALAEIDALLHKALPIHFGRNGFRTRGLNYLEQQVDSMIESLVHNGEVDKETLQEYALHGRPVHPKGRKKRRPKDFPQKRLTESN